MELLVAVRPQRVEHVNLVPPSGQHPIQPVEVGAAFLKTLQSQPRPVILDGEQLPQPVQSHLQFPSSVISAVVSPASAIIANRTSALISAHPAPSGPLEANPPFPGPL